MKNNAIYSPFDKQKQYKIAAGLARWEGVNARRHKIDIDKNPYKLSPNIKDHQAVLHTAWNAGWIAEHKRICNYLKTKTCIKGA